MLCRLTDRHLPNSPAQLPLNRLTSSKKPKPGESSLFRAGYCRSYLVDYARPCPVFNHFKSPFIGTLMERNWNVRLKRPNHPAYLQIFVVTLERTAGK